MHLFPCPCYATMQLPLCHGQKSVSLSFMPFYTIMPDEHRIECTNNAAVMTAIEPQTVAIVAVSNTVILITVDCKCENLMPRQQSTDT